MAFTARMPRSVFTIISMELFFTASISIRVAGIKQRRKSSTRGPPRAGAEGYAARLTFKKAKEGMDIAIQW